MPKLSDNLLANLDKDKQSEIGSKVIDDYTIDNTSKVDFDERNKEAYKLFQGMRESRTIPHLENPANVCVPLTTVASLQFQARAYDSLIPGRDVVRAYSTDGKSIDEAKRITKHFNWQLLEEMTEWEEEMDKALLMLAITGNAFKKTYYNASEKRNYSELVSPSELVINYECKSISYAKRISHRIQMSSSDLIKMERDNIFINVSELKDSDGRVPEDSLGDLTYQDSVNENLGITQNYLKNEREIIEQHRFLDLDDDGIEEPYIVWVDKLTSIPLRLSTRTYTDPITRKEKVLNFFTHYYLIPNPESLYGYGFGLILNSINETANSIVNELVDAGNLNNMQSGFVNSRSGIPRYNEPFKRGELRFIEGRTDKLSDDIYLFDFKPPSQALFGLLGLLYEYGKEISSISDAMIGKLPPSDTTATSFMAVLEQGLKVFSIIHKRIHRTLKQECKNLFILNKLYLDEKVYFYAQDSTSEEIQTLSSGREDYTNNIDIIPVSDPTIVSKAEKAAKANGVYQLIMGNPLTNQNQQSIYEALKNVLIANDVANWQKLLPDPTTIKPEDYSPVEENARFLKDQDSPVLEQQDHLAHMEAHQTFKQSQFSEQLTPQGNKLMEFHEKQHISFLYMQSEEGAIK